MAEAWNLSVPWCGLTAFAMWGMWVPYTWTLVVEDIRPYS